MKNVLNKTLAALVIAAAMTTPCTTVYAEEAPAHAEEAYTVTEDEQEAVTICFDDLVLSLDENYAENEAEENDGITPYGDVARDEIAKNYWGLYTSADGNYSLSIRGGRAVTFRGLKDHIEYFCYYEYVSSIYFYPNAENSENFVVHYSPYAKIENSVPTRVDGEFILKGKFNKHDRTFTLFEIVYYPQ